jgi:hypothetical protein
MAQVDCSPGPLAGQTEVNQPVISLVPHQVNHRGRRAIPPQSATTRGRFSGEFGDLSTKETLKIGQ